MIWIFRREAFFVGRKALATFYLAVFAVAVLAFLGLCKVASVVWGLLR